MKNNKIKTLIIHMAKKFLVLSILFIVISFSTGCGKQSSGSLGGAVPSGGSINMLVSSQGLSNGSPGKRDLLSRSPR